MAERVTDRSRAIATAIVFVAAFGVYLKTLAPAVGPTDSGELTPAASGPSATRILRAFPFFLIVTHFFTWLPLGSIAVRANIASAFFSAIACAFLALAAAEILLF